MTFNHVVESSSLSTFTIIRGVAQLVERDIWDVEAAGSNPVTPTKIRIGSINVMN